MSKERDELRIHPFAGDVANHIREIENLLKSPRNPTSALIRARELRQKYERDAWRVCEEEFEAEHEERSEQPVHDLDREWIAVCGKGVVATGGTESQAERAAHEFGEEFDEIVAVPKGGVPHVF